jgi:hypothetical protein
VFDVQGHKSELPADTPTFTGYPIAPACESVGVPFTGWTYYGFWQNGELLRGKPGLSIWHGFTPRVTAEDRAARRAAWKEQVKHAAISRQEAASALESHLGYVIPTMDEAML